MQKRNERLHAAGVFLTRQGAGGVLADIVVRFCQREDQLGNGLIAFYLTQRFRNGPAKIGAALPGGVQEWLHGVCALRHDGVEGIGAEVQIGAVQKADDVQQRAVSRPRCVRFRREEGSGAGVTQLPGIHFAADLLTLKRGREWHDQYAVAGGYQPQRGMRGQAITSAQIGRQDKGTSWRLRNCGRNSRLLFHAVLGLVIVIPLIGLMLIVRRRCHWNEIPSTRRKSDGLIVKGNTGYFRQVGEDFLFCLNCDSSD